MTRFTKIGSTVEYKIFFEFENSTYVFFVEIKTYQNGTKGAEFWRCLDHEDCGLKLRTSQKKQLKKEVQEFINNYLFNN